MKRENSFDYLISVNVSPFLMKFHFHKLLFIIEPSKLVCIHMQCIYLKYNLHKFVLPNFVLSK